MLSFMNAYFILSMKKHENESRFVIIVECGLFSLKKNNKQEGENDKIKSVHFCLPANSNVVVLCFT